jgi:hypothetical protein
LLLAASAAVPCTRTSLPDITTRAMELPGVCACVGSPAVSSYKLIAFNKSLHDMGLRSPRNRAISWHATQQQIEMTLSALAFDPPCPPVYPDVFAVVGPYAPPPRAPRHVQMVDRTRLDVHPNPPPTPALSFGAATLSLGGRRFPRHPHAALVDCHQPPTLDPVIISTP